MTTYTQLQTDVAAWVIGQDLATQIPAFIRLAEDRHTWGQVAEDGRRNQFEGAIRVRANERRARAVGNGTPYVALPTDYLEHRLLRFVGSTQRDRDLIYVEPENMEFSAQAKPTRYTVVREELEFNGNLAATVELEMYYYVPFDRLTDASETNWLLANAYGCYLWAAVAEAHYYIQDIEAAAAAELKYAQAVGALMGSARRARRNQGQLRVVTSGRSTP